MFEAVIFDCDGVLVDSEPIAERVLAEVLTEHGRPTTAAQIAERFIGLAWPQIIERLDLEADSEAAVRVTTDYRDRLTRAFATELRAVEGVAAVVAGLNVPVAVASNSRPERVEQALEVTGLLPRFAGRIFTAYDAGRPKPDPAVYLSAAQALGVEPGRCAVVEDTAVGATAGVRAGMTVFGYAPDGADGWPPGARPFRAMADLGPLLARPDARPSPSAPR